MGKAFQGGFPSEVQQPFRLYIEAGDSLCPQVGNGDALLGGDILKATARDANGFDGGDGDNRLGCFRAYRPSEFAKVAGQIDEGDLPAAVGKQPVAAGPALYDHVNSGGCLALAKQITVAFRTNNLSANGLLPECIRIIYSGIDWKRLSMHVVTLFGLPRGTQYYPSKVGPEAYIGWSGAIRGDEPGIILDGQSISERSSCLGYSGGRAKLLAIRTVYYERSAV